MIAAGVAAVAAAIAAGACRGQSRCDYTSKIECTVSGCAALGCRRLPVTSLLRRRSSRDATRDGRSQPVGDPGV
jgi:hypothetical protein